MKHKKHAIKRPVHERPAEYKIVKIKITIAKLSALESKLPKWDTKDEDRNTHPPKYTYNYNDPLTPKDIGQIMGAAYRAGARSVKFSEFDSSPPQSESSSRSYGASKSRNRVA